MDKDLTCPHCGGDWYMREIDGQYECMGCGYKTWT